MKSELTKSIEKKLFKSMEKLGQFLVLECCIGFGGGDNDRVDAISYNTTKKEITCFEIKVSVTDFHSKNKLSFVGNRNYFILTEDVYDKVKNEIPKQIGVYIYEPKHYEPYRYNYNNNEMQEIGDKLVLVKPCKKQDCHYDKEVLLACMVRSRVNKTNLQIYKDLELLERFE